MTKIEGIHYSTGKPIQLSMQGGMITEIIEIPSCKTENIIAPGLIDNQVNGYLGIDFSGDSLDTEGIEKVTKALWQQGVTSYLPTLITNSHESLKRNFKIFSELTDDSLFTKSIIGYHLEGPYISPEPGFVGCHPMEHVRKPDWDEFQELQKAASGRIVQVTLAPEMEGSLGFIQHCVNSGIVVSLGHTNAGFDIIKAAVEAGASLSTHLGNGCANLIHRHNNPIWPQLDCDDLTPSVIADGHHLPPELIRTIFKVKGKDNLILTSDVAPPAGMRPGKYFFAGSDVELKKNGRLESISNNCLAGASFSLKAGVENMVKFVGCTLSEAIDMASKNPARVYGFTDRGVIEKGKRADIILIQNDHHIHIKETYVLGENVL
ncbi:MAG: N-acetylglucosamine-6-phosphate deacetylase [Bacteroidetes bacterium]|nr:N-acetylglucosamine-6-phosphate deacetylase [Bacteroidota bacterium]MDA1119719.1 N-acetylglucosamine-6-phosphate deacetylase [Bacteroidota bacterium]